MALQDWELQRLQPMARGWGRDALALQQGLWKEGIHIPPAGTGGPPSSCGIASLAWERKSGLVSGAGPADSHTGAQIRFPMRFQELALLAGLDRA